jgi:hypothetical protein
MPKFFPPPQNSDFGLTVFVQDLNSRFVLGNLEGARAEPGPGDWLS